MNSDSLYKENIMDHYKHPRNQGALKDYTHRSAKANRSCGDEIEVWLDVDPEGKIKDIGYEVRGCAISVAAISMVSERLKGAQVDDLEKIEDNEVTQMLGITAGGAREKCALLGIGAIRSALGV